MNSALRPRDIQSRIRAGESAEDVAAAAGTPVEKIMIYAAPVLAEREHMAVRAQDSSVRRRVVGDTGARTLGQAVEMMMHEAEADHDTIEWDAWQREDRRWVLIASYESRLRNGIAEFVFDPRGNYVTTSNDDAKWLVGEELPVAPPVRDDLQEARERRAETPVVLEATPEPMAATPAVREPAPATQTSTSQTPTAAQRATQPDEGHEAIPVAETINHDDEPTIDLGETAARIRDMVAADEADSVQLALDDVPEPAPAPAPKRKKARRSVPSWDEIMFGGGPTKDE